MLSSVRRPPPICTGISPKEGPPGTRVTIRGENLGLDARDLIGLRLCGFDCLLSAEWCSSNKITARTGQAKGKGDIIVVTRSGGVGSCTVSFRGYFIQTGPLQDSAVWVDESEASFMGHGRTSVSAVPEHDDPLGISDEQNEAKYSEEKLTKMFPEGSGDTSLQNFVPEWYLLENHNGTRFDDLKAGLAHLKRRTQTQREGPLAFIKANLSTFMDCQDTLKAMHSKLQQDEASVKSGCLTDALQRKLLDANKSANALFQDVLGRKDRADATRNALGVLQRFKFLFHLPMNIDQNIKSGDYDLVITDYSRAKSLFGSTEVQIFKKVYNEVERRISLFRDKLHGRLMALPSTLDEQKKLIRYLVHLETIGDPAWDCIVNMQVWLYDLLCKCKEDHIKRSHDPPSIIIEEPKLSPSRRYSTLSHGDSSYKSSVRAPEKVQFVEHLTRLFIQNLPDLWKLGQAYFTGKLLKEEGDKNSDRIDSSKHILFKTMILEICQIFGNLLRSAFLPKSLDGCSVKDKEFYGIWPESADDSPLGWLPVCVRHVRNCILALVSVDLPEESQQMLLQLGLEMRGSCMSTLLERATCDAKQLVKEESWQQDSYEGGTTHLPILFESLVSETFQHLHEVLISKPGECELFSDPVIRQQVHSLIEELLQSFAAALYKLADIGNDSPLISKRLKLPVNDEVKSFDKLDTPSLDKRLMVVLSNCDHMVQVILPKLCDMLEKQGYVDTNIIRQVSEKSYTDLDARLFENYVEEKSNPMIGLLEASLYVGDYDWSKAPPCVEVRRYVKELMMGVIEIHAEVFVVCPRFVSRIMPRIVTAAIEETSRLIQCVSSFNSNGILQAQADLAALEEAFKTHLTEAGRRSLLEARGHLKGSYDKQALQVLLEDFRGGARLQLTCLRRAHRR